MTAAQIRFLSLVRREVNRFLKIKRQTNPEAFRGRGVMRIIADEGFGLYRGWGWTAARNAPGSFAVRLFSSSSHHALASTPYPA